MINPSLGLTYTVTPSSPSTTCATGGTVPCWTSSEVRFTVPVGTHGGKDWWIRITNAYGPTNYNTNSPLFYYGTVRKGDAPHRTATERREYQWNRSATQRTCAKSAFSFPFLGRCG